METDQRTRYNLYFVIRSIITASIGFATFSLAALMLGSLSGVQAIVLSFSCFAYPVLLTNILHARIQGIVERMLAYLENHQEIKRLLLRFLK